MALSNEAYIVNTATAGEVIVPIKETVPYLNVNLIGYQHFSYHSIMSQNLANIVDDIKALQDGGLAQATFDLDQLIADANANIDSKINLFNDAIYAKIVLLTDEAITETRKAIEEFQTEIYGPDGDNGVIANTAANTAAIGNSTSGIIQQLDIIEDTVGISGTGGLIQQFTGVESIVAQVATDVATHSDDIIDIKLIIEADVTGLVPRMTTVETLIGGTNSGLIKDTQLNKDMIFGDGTYEGILSILGDNTRGLIHYAQLTRTEFDNDMADLKPRLSYVENRLGSNDESGIIAEVNTLNSEVDTLNSLVGLNISSGLQLKVKTLENFNIQEIRDSLYIAGTGLEDKTVQLRTELDALKAETDAFNINNDNDIQNLQSQINLTVTNTTTNTTNLSNLTIKVNDIDDDINSAGGIKDQLLNSVSSTVDTALTYDDNGVDVIFTPSVLFNMKVETDALSADNIAARFVTYFGTNLNALNSNEIGKAALDLWIADTGIDGYVKKTNSVILNYLTDNYTMSNIQANVDAITLLNADEVTPGSVAHAVETLKNSIDEELNGTTGSITIINGNDTVVGSTDKKIKDSIDAYDLTVESRLTTITESISDSSNSAAALVSEVRQELNDQTSELQVEMVRYDTILPFLQKMFKYVNTPGSIEDTEIDTIFATIADKIKTVGAPINNDYIFRLNTETKNFEILIQLDADLKFVEIDPVNAPNEYMTLSRVDNYGGLVDDFISTTLDPFGNLSIESGLFQGTRDAILCEAPDWTVCMEVNDLTSDNNDTITLNFATVDIFGNYKLHHIPIS